MFLVNIMETDEQNISEFEEGNIEDEDVIEEPEEIQEVELPKLYAKLDTTEPAYSFSRYFVYSRGGAKCRACGRSVLRKGGNTSSMKTHLSSAHKQLYKEFELAKKQNQSHQVKRQRDEGTSGDAGFNFGFLLA